MSHDLTVSRTDLHDTRIVDTGPSGALQPGQARMRIDRFAITANNITYGVFGDALEYWTFFPAEEGYGRIPVWGFADVEATECDGVNVGDRLYGYWPMSDRLVVEPVKISRHGWADGIGHRAELPPVYNRYSLTAADPLYRQEYEAEHMLLVPLFTTSFVLRDFVLDNDNFGASQVVITSASSKTAIGTAHLFHEDGAAGPGVIGLTSAGNRDFVESLGIYDSVLTYDDVGMLPESPSVLLDFSGDFELRHAIHSRLADGLRHSSAIGATHWDSGRDNERPPLPGPKPSMFFAPAQIQKRYKDWGADEFQQRLARSWFDFVTTSRDWMTVETVTGLEAAEDVFHRFLDRKAPPSIGYVVEL